MSPCSRRGRSLGLVLPVEMIGEGMVVQGPGTQNVMRHILGGVLGAVAVFAVAIWQSW